MSVQTKKWMVKLGFSRPTHMKKKSRLPNVGSSQTQPTSITPAIVPLTTQPKTISTTSSTTATTTTSAPAKASPTIRDLWSDALQTLPQDDQAAIQSMQPAGTRPRPLSENIEELVGMARTKQSECETKSYRVVLGGKELILRDVAEKTIVWLQKFIAVGDVAVGYDQVHASLPWAGVRFMLQIFVAESTQMGALLVGIETITYLVGRCAIYESLYRPRATPKDALQNLEAVLTELYAVILGLIALTYRLLSKTTGIRALHALVKPSEVLDYVNKCRDLQARVDVEAQNCERILNRDAREVDLNTQKLLGILSTPILRSDKKVSTLLETVNGEERLKILDWISDVLYRANHRTVADSRTQGTCEWILKHPSYFEWYNSSSSVTLWLYGTAGTGKTFLVSKVIDEIQDILKNDPNHEGIAFFYCNRNDPERREPLAVLRSFVRQLSTTANGQHSMQQRIRQYYNKSREEGSTPTINDCKELLLELINTYPKTTIILDALDECEEQKRSVLVEVVNYFVASASRPVKIFISSRPYIDIRDMFWNHANIGIQATDNHDDISKFVESEIVRHRRWNKMPTELQKDIVDTLQDRSQGMFQWAYLQIKQLLVLQQEKHIRARLGKLPADLKDTYTEIFDAMDEIEREVANRAFQWVMCSRKPLSTGELLPAVCQDGGDTINSIDDLDEDLLLKYCHNLLIIDPNRAVWVPSHLSVIEYCEELLWNQKQANSLVTAVCLTLLNDPAYHIQHNESKNEDEKSGLSSGHQFYNLVIYAAHHWMIHARECENNKGNNSRISGLLGRFLGSPTESMSAFQSWHRIFRGLLRDQMPPSSVFKRSEFTPRDLEPTCVSTFAVCAFGLYALLPNCWATPWPDLVGKNSQGRSVLQLAVLGGSLPLCKRLLEWGADVNEQLISKLYANALVAAVSRSDRDMVRLLIDSGADVNAQLLVGSFGSALDAAVQLADIDTMELLINLGADVNACLMAHNFGSALAAAAGTERTRGSMEDVVDLLIKSRADVNAQLFIGDWGSALSSAAYVGDIKVVKLLLDAGADPNAPLHVGQFGSALAAAATKGHLEVVKLLIESGAQVNVPLQEGQFSAITGAADRRRGQIVEILVELGAEVEVEVETGGLRTVLAKEVDYHKTTFHELLVSYSRNLDAMYRRIYYT
ncbi:hypothetical protein FQN53_005988 [Emmonsiellopsis sp. PD_33]|nr:hypothetical protein FQN53_005988 [Emmonsiellopsis sp. PD_33]